MDPSGRSRRGPGATRGFSPAPRDAVSPLQLSVYWRLALAHFFTSFLFFLDVYAAAAVSCRHGNGTEEGGNRSRPAEDSDGGKRNLVCDWTDWLAYAQTLYMVGLLLGSLVGGAVSDRYGKRTVLLVCVYVHALCGLVPALLPRAFLYLAVRCVTGVCCCCINICSFSLAVEWTPPAARLWASAFLPFCFSLGMMGGAPLAWLSATWTRLHLTLAVPQLVCLPLYLWIPESPRWLLLRRRTDVLDRYRDNSPADKQCLDLLLWSDLQKDTEDQKDPPPGGHAPSDIIYLRHPTVLLRLFVMSFVRYDTYLQLHIKTRSKGAWFNPPSPPQCGVSSHLLRHLHEHRLLRRRRLLRPVLLRPIGGTLPPRPIGPPGPPANQHARSVPEWSGLLPVLTAVPIRRSAGVGDESRSAGEALHPGRALHLHPVQHRAVPHRGQTAVRVLGQPVFPDWLPGQLRGPRHPHRGHLIGCHGRVQQRPNRGLRSVSASPGDQRRPAARLGRGLRQAADAPPPERGRPLEEVEAGEKPNQEY